MSERGTQRSEDVDVSEAAELSVDVETEFEDPDGAEPPRSEDSSGAVRSLYGRTLGRVLSGRGTVLALSLALLFSVLFGLLPFVGLLGNLLGIGVAGFVYGLAVDHRRYLELLVAGSAVGGAAAVLGNLLVITLGSMTGLLGVGLLGGAVAATLGHYFGRDFRAGLTRDV